MVVGIEGKLGSEVAGSGGRVSFGMVGMVGRDGCGRDGIVGKGGTLPWGCVGIVGKEGMPGKFGAVVCKRWRAARPISMHEKEIAMRKAKMKQLWEAIAKS